jgi:chitinase
MNVSNLRYLTVAASFLAISFVQAAPSRAAGPPLWVTAYYADWQQQSGYLPPEKIDFAAVSHIIHFSVVPKADGTIDDTGGDFITPAQSQALLTPAHAAGCKVLLCVGGADTSPRFRAALGDSVRPAFIRNLVAFTAARGYDGIDIDMEPLQDSDAPQFEAFIGELRTAMNAVDPHLLLTAATAQQPAVFAKLQSQFDQINVMTYDLSGPWQGFRTWHNSSLYGAGDDMMTGQTPYPSSDATLRGFIKAGVPKSKLAIGLAFYGTVWNGASAPGQDIANVKFDSSVDYHTIMDKYAASGQYQWDTRAHAPYYSIGGPSPQDRKFVSYDDERLCAEKIAYARKQGLGGVMIWELGSGYRADQPAGQRDSLLQAVKRAWRTGMVEK